MNADQRAKGSLNQEYARICGGKLRHQNFLTAMFHAKALQDKDGADMAIYRCPYCGTEHVGRVYGRSQIIKHSGIGRADTVESFFSAIKTPPIARQRLSGQLCVRKDGVVCPAPREAGD